MLQYSTHERYMLRFLVMRSGSSLLNHGCITDPNTGARRVARVRAIFHLPETVGRLQSPLLYVKYFTPLQQVDKRTRMYMVKRDVNRDGVQLAGIITPESLIRTCHLIPKWEDDILRVIKPEDVLDRFSVFYVNDFLDLHSYINT